MPKKALNLTSYLAVLVLLVTAFLLSVGSVSGKSALGGSGFGLGLELEKSVSNSLLALEKSFSCRTMALGICDGPEGNVNTNSVDANSGEIFDPGLNITPNSTLNNYPSVGPHGTFVTDSKTIENIIGPVPDGATEIRITRQQAQTLESNLGLNPNSLEQSNTLSIVSDIPDRCPRCPVGNAGNDLFLGGGEGLPGGGPELVIDSIPSAGGDGIRQITIIVED